MPPTTLASSSSSISSPSHGLNHLIPSKPTMPRKYSPCLRPIGLPAWLMPYGSTLCVPIFFDQLPLDWTVTLILDVFSFPFRTFPSSFSYLAPLPHATVPTSLETNGKLAARLIGRHVCTNERRFLYGQLYPYLLPVHNPKNTTIYPLPCYRFDLLGLACI